MFGRADRDDLAPDRRPGRRDSGIGSAEYGAVPLGGDVDSVGVAQRPEGKPPRAVYVGPGCRLDHHLEGLGVLGHMPRSPVRSR